MKQYVFGFASAILLLVIALLFMGFTPNPNIASAGKYQIDTVLMTQEDSHIVTT